MITVLTYFEEVTEEMGPIRLLADSHRGPLYDHYDKSGWIGRLPDEVVATLPMDQAVSLCGPAVPSSCLTTLWFTALTPIAAAVRVR